MGRYDLQNFRKLFALCAGFPARAEYNFRRTGAWSTMVTPSHFSGTTFSAPDGAGMNCGSTHTAHETAVLATLWYTVLPKTAIKCTTILGLRKVSAPGL